jgi:hypothetical protein
MLEVTCICVAASVRLSRAGCACTDEGDSAQVNKGVMGARGVAGNGPSKMRGTQSTDPLLEEYVFGCVVDSSPLSRTPCCMVGSGVSR